MSYILDALKKVEHEKVRKAMVGGMTSITGDLFQERVPRRSPGGIGKIIVVIVFVSLATCAATWFLLKGDKKQGATAVRSAVSPAVTAPPASPSLTVAAPAPVARLPEAAVPASQVSPQAGAADSDDGERAGRIAGKSVHVRPVVPQPHKSAVQTIPAPADIKVSGIAWQEERAARRAVINGFLLQEGTVVSGARILEIHQDRVRLASPAGIFDVRMDAATLPGLSK